MAILSVFEHRLHRILILLVAFESPRPGDFIIVLILYFLKKIYKKGKKKKKVFFFMQIARPTLKSSNPWSYKEKNIF